jgi:hypothetical protein
MSPLEVNIAVLDPDSRHHAIANEADIVFKYRRIAIIWLDSMKGSICLGRNYAVNFQVYDISFQP